MKILIADSNVMTRKIMANLLTSVGYDVVTVRDGIELLGQLAKGAHAIITELELPLVSGFVVADTVKQLKQPIPIVVVTASSPEEVAALPLPLPPIVSVLHKPVQVKDVLEVVMKLSCPACSDSLKLAIDNNAHFSCSGCHRSWLIKERIEGRLGFVD